MSNASTSRLRGKVFDPRERRPDFVIEPETKFVTVDNRGNRTFEGSIASRGGNGIR